MPISSGKARHANVDVDRVFQPFDGEPLETFATSDRQVDAADAVRLHEVLHLEEHEIGARGGWRVGDDEVPAFVQPLRECGPQGRTQLLVVRVVEDAQ